MSSQAGIRVNSAKFVTIKPRTFKGEIIVKVFFVGANGKVARHFAISSNMMPLFKKLR